MRRRRSYCQSISRVTALLLTPDANRAASGVLRCLLLIPKTARMPPILSIVLVSVGVALLFSRLFARRRSDLDLPRPDAPKRLRHGSLLTGSLLVLVGVAGWLLSPALSP
jgi:hypothetical protein